MGRGTEMPSSCRPLGDPGLLSEPALALGVLRQGKVVQRNRVPRHRTDRVGKTQLDPLVFVGHLRQDAARAVDPLREGVALADRQAEEVGFEFHGADCLPVGKRLSSLEVNGVDEIHPMDLYEARRQALLRLVNGEPYGGSQAAFCRAAGIAPSYLTRMLKPEGHRDRKRIGDEIAMRLETALRLPSGDLVSPVLGQVGEMAVRIVPSSSIQAHALSHQPFDHPLLKREELMSLEEVPARFTFALEDDAMGDFGRAGTEVLFQAVKGDAEAKLGAGILVKDRRGDLHVRRKVQGRSASHYLAAAPNGVYRSLDSEADGLQILAVWRGVVNKGLEDA